MVKTSIVKFQLSIITKEIKGNWLKVIQRHVFLRIKNVNNTVNMYYSEDGVKWNKTENSAEVSALHHNVLGGFLSLRIGLCSIGEGEVKFKNFIYKPLK